VGAGYARRARYAEAIQRLSKAVELDGSAVTTRLLLANCYLVRGERTQAGEEYSAVLKLDPGLVSAQEGLRAAEAPPAPEPAGSGEATATAKAAVTEALAGLTTAAEAVAAATEDLPKQLRPTAEAMQRSTDALVRVGSRVPQLPPEAREVTVTTGLAIADASESLYCLERVSELLGAAVAGGRRMTEAAQGIGPSALDSRQAAVLTRAGSQLGKCAAEVQALAADVPNLVKTIQNTGHVAESAADRVGGALLPGSTLAERQIAFDSVKLSQQKGEKTRDKTREAALRAAQARARSLVAEIDTAGVVLGRQRAEACDNLVAYYTQTDPARARAFRQDHHLGLGEAALLLAAAKSAQRPVDSLLELAGTGIDVVDAAQQADAHLTNVNFFLHFIADALAKEAAS
jgi:tetratricopeptide (TPR) repeat protein